MTTKCNEVSWMQSWVKTQEREAHWTLLGMVISGPNSCVAETTALSLCLTGFVAALVLAGQIIVSVSTH